MLCWFNLMTLIKCHFWGIFAENSFPLKVKSPFSHCKKCKFVGKIHPFDVVPESDIFSLLKYFCNIADSGCGGKPWNNVGKAETAINVSAWVPPPLSSSLLLSTSDSRDAKLTEVSSASPPELTAPSNIDSRHHHTTPHHTTPHHTTKLPEPETRYYPCHHLT